MSKIVPHLWFDKEAVEAAEFYLSIFPNSKKLNQTVIKDTPSGDCDFLTIELFGQEFMLISAGPYFTINSSVSFLVNCASPEEAYSIYSKLLENDAELLPIDEYDFSQSYWLTDRYDVSWMVQCPKPLTSHQIIPVLLFMGDLHGKAEEAVNFYASIFKNSKVESPTYILDDIFSSDTIFSPQISFTLEGQPFMALEKVMTYDCPFSEAISLLIYTDTQEEIDYYWDALSAVPESEQCGWLKDKYGFSWQVSPRIMHEMMNDENETRRNAVTQCMLQMKKLDIKELQLVYAQNS